MPPAGDRDSAPKTREEALELLKSPDGVSRWNALRASDQAVNLDFDGADLSGADLREASLEGATLRGTLLMDANLEGAILIGADLDEAALAALVTRDSMIGVEKLGGRSPSSTRRVPPHRPWRTASSCSKCPGKAASSAWPRASLSRAPTRGTTSASV